MPTIGFPSSKTPAIVTPVVPDVLQEHLEELGFLSLQRRKLLFSRETNLRQLAQHDRRIDAHAAALAVQPEPAAAMAKERLAEAESAWDVMACARMWIGGASPPPEEVFEAVAGGGDEAAPGWREALRRSPRERVAACLARLDPGASGVLASVFVDAGAWHGVLPAPLAQAAARSPEPAVRRALARHPALFERLPIAEPELGRLAQDDDASVARAARWTSLLLNFARRARSIDEPRQGAADPFWSLAASLLAPDPEPGPDETTLVAWQRAVRGGEDPLRIRGEVPDGFFSGELADEALAGE